MELLIWLVSFIILFCLSVPLHEGSHVLAIRILGGKHGKITWFTINFSAWGITFGRVSGTGRNGDEFSFPALSEKYLKVVALWCGFAGGLGSAIILAQPAWYFLLNPLPDPLSSLWRSFLLVSVIQFINGIGEGIFAVKTAQLIAGK